MDNTYWQKQSPTEPLFPEIEWNRPEQKTRAGKLLIIGGNKMGFTAVSYAYEEALSLGAGQVRIILPDVLKKTVPPTVLDAAFVPSNPSGGMSKDGQGTIKASLSWADHVLLVGDAGRNSETAAIFEDILSAPVPLTITRDAVDLLKNSAERMVGREKTTLVVSFAQLQKIFQTVYYPKILSFSMPLMTLVDVLHKFTVTYPSTIVTFHQSQLIVAHDGKVVTMEFDEPMMIWRGSTATRAACYQLWTPSKPLEAIATSFVA